MNKQQIKQILDNAPEGATHFDSIVYYKARFNDSSLNAGWDVFSTGNGKWESVGDCYLTDVYKIKDLSGLHTQLALIEENEKLKANAEKLVRYGFSKSGEGFNYEYPFNDGATPDDLDSLIVEWATDAIKELSND